MLELKSSYAGFLFDMDGTLVDSRLVVERTWRDWAGRHQLNLDSILARSHGRRTIDTISEFAPDGVDIAQEADEFDAIEANDINGIVAVPGASAFLKQLPKDKWAVVTSAGRLLAERRIQAAGLPLPDVMVTADDVRHGKPDPEGYIKAAFLLGAEPEACVVFEDAPAGIEAAQAAGCDLVAIRCASPNLTVYHCQSVEDFTDIVLI